MTETSTYTHQELSARLAEVERERDALRMELDACRHTNNGLHKDKVELAAMAGRLRETLGAVRDDLLERGEIGSDGARVVGVGRGIWCQLHDALEETPPTALAEIRAEAVEAAVRSYFEEDKGPHDLHGYCKWYAQQLRNGASQ